MRIRTARIAVLAAVMAVVTLCVAQPAQAGIVQFADNFDSTSHPGWWTDGGAGFDYGKGYAHHGPGNAWVRNTTGWNAVNTVVGVYPNADCVASAWLRLSDGLTAGYMSIRSRTGSPGPVLHEIWLVGPGPVNETNANYNHYLFHFNPGNSSQVQVYVGLWGNGRDSWIQADDVVVQCPTPY